MQKDKASRCVLALFSFILPAAALQCVCSHKTSRFISGTEAAPRPFLPSSTVHQEDLCREGIRMHQAVPAACSGGETDAQGMVAATTSTAQGGASTELWSDRRGRMITSNSERMTQRGAGDETAGLWRISWILPRKEGRGFLGKGTNWMLRQEGGREPRRLGALGSQEPRRNDRPRAFQTSNRQTYFGEGPEGTCSGLCQPHFLCHNHSTPLPQRESRPS